jgi:hypothetical protein
VAKTAGAQWSLFAGRLWVQELGQLRWTDSNADGQYDIGEKALASGPSSPVTVPPEGMRFFRGAVPVGTLGWSLWLRGDFRPLMIKKARVPFSNENDHSQQGQMLLVPPYLDSGESYFLSFSGTPGESVSLDSRIQEVRTDLAFGASVTAEVTADDPPFQVFRVQVPVDQIGWEIATTALSGDPNICARRRNLGSENENDAYSEVAGSVKDSFTMVPDFLTDGTWYITVYGYGPYKYTLKNANPTITPTNYTSSQTNDETTRAGWRYYSLNNIGPNLDAQLQNLGWELNLAGQVSGTEIAIRRNALPSRWNYRTSGENFYTYTYSDKRNNLSGDRGFLQDPGHQADVWYVGVYSPSAALGAFQLYAAPIVPADVQFDGGSRTVQSLAPGRWSYVKVTVPEVGKGWDVRLSNVTGEMPYVVIKRDVLPNDYTFYWYNPMHLTREDWSGLENGNRHTIVPFPWSDPLGPGTYYIGVYNASGSPVSYTLESRGIGAGQRIPIVDLAFQNGSVDLSGLAARENRFFRVVIPENTPSWEMTLTPSTGDMAMVVRRGFIPTVSPPYGFTHSSSLSTDTVADGQLMRKSGAERFVLFPRYDEKFLVPGEYYIGVSASETSNGVLRSLGTVAVTDLGSVSAVEMRKEISLVAGQTKLFQFSVPSGSETLEAHLETVSGSPEATMRYGTEIPHTDYNYGVSGGQAPDASSLGSIKTVTLPAAGTYSVVVTASSTNGAQDSSAVLKLRVFVWTVDFRRRLLRERQL